MGINKMREKQSYTSLLKQAIAELDVDKPDSVKVSESITTKAVIIQIRVDANDCGKIIGKHGRTIEALKVVCLRAKNNLFPNDSRRVLIEVLEDG